MTSQVSANPESIDPATDPDSTDPEHEDGILPLIPDRHPRVALIGPVADDPMAVLGCCSLPADVSANTGHGLGLDATGTPVVLVLPVGAEREAGPGRRPLSSTRVERVASVGAPASTA